MTTGVWRTLAIAWWTRFEHWLRTSDSFTVRQAARRVFFPGCSLSGADPELVARVVEHLRQQDSSVGLWSECCGSPLAQLGGVKETRPHQQSLAERLRNAGVREVITACGNCAVSLEQMRSDVPGLQVRSLYEVLAKDPPTDLATADPLAVHHPCPARTRPAQRQAFFALADRVGITLSNRERAGHALPCCLKRGPAAQKRRLAMAHQEVVTYCAHCTMSFQRDVPTRHILQLVFGTDSRWHKKGKLALFESYLALKSAAATRLWPRSPKPLTASRLDCTQSDP